MICIKLLANNYKLICNIATLGCNIAMLHFRHKSLICNIKRVHLLGVPRMLQVNAPIVALKVK